MALPTGLAKWVAKNGNTLSREAKVAGEEGVKTLHKGRVAAAAAGVGAAAYGAKKAADELSDDDDDKKKKKRKKPEYLDDEDC